MGVIARSGSLDPLDIGLVEFLLNSPELPFRLQIVRLHHFQEVDMPFVSIRRHDEDLVLREKVAVERLIKRLPDLLGKAYLRKEHQSIGQRLVKVLVIDAITANDKVKRLHVFAGYCLRLPILMPLPTPMKLLPAHNRVPKLVHIS